MMWLGWVEKGQLSRDAAVFLSNEACIEGQEEVLCHVNTKECNALYDLHSVFINVKCRVVA